MCQTMYKIYTCDLIKTLQEPRGWVFLVPFTDKERECEQFVYSKWQRQDLNALVCNSTLKVEIIN